MNQPMIFGIRPILEALEEGKSIDKVFLKAGLEGDLSKELMGTLKAHNVPFQIVPFQRLNRFTRKNHQGAVALISPIEFADLNETITGLFEKGIIPVVVLLDGVSDIRNFGAIVRSAECLGAHTVAIPHKGSAAVSPDAVKTSAGALMRMPVCKVNSSSKAVEDLQRAGLKVFCLTEKASAELHEIDLNGPLAIVMGADDTGVSTEVLRKADDLAKIPMQGKTGSLNVSVSAGIALYEASRQRNN